MEGVGARPSLDLGGGEGQKGCVVARVHDLAWLTQGVEAKRRCPVTACGCELVGRPEVGVGVRQRMGEAEPDCGQDWWQAEVADASGEGEGHTWAVDTAA